MMRFRLANSIYVYGIDKKKHFDEQVLWVGCYGLGWTYRGFNTIPVRNYGIEPRDWSYEEYDPRHAWYQSEIQRVLKKFPKKQRSVKYCYAWDILNYHAHTIQIAIKRFIAKKRVQKTEPVLQHQRSYWDAEDLVLCQRFLGEPLTYGSEDRYYEFLEKFERERATDRLLEHIALEESLLIEPDATKEHFDGLMAISEVEYEDAEFDCDREYEEIMEEDEKLRQFQEEADDWYDWMISQKEENKLKMSAQKFSKWEKKFEKDMSEREKNYELYLRTGFAKY